MSYLISVAPGGNAHATAIPCDDAAVGGATAGGAAARHGHEPDPGGEAPGAQASNDDAEILREWLVHGARSLHGRSNRAFEHFDRLVFQKIAAQHVPLTWPSSCNWDAPGLTISAGRDVSASYDPEWLVRLKGEAWTRQLFESLLHEVYWVRYTECEQEYSYELAYFSEAIFGESGRSLLHGLIITGAEQDRCWITHPFPTLLRELKELAEVATGMDYDTCNLALYRSGDDWQDMHLDDIDTAKWLTTDSQPLVAISLGAERVFVWRHVSLACFCCQHAAGSCYAAACDRWYCPACYEHVAQLRMPPPVTRDVERHAALEGLEFAITLKSGSLLQQHRVMLENYTHGLPRMGAGADAGAGAGAGAAGAGGTGARILVFFYKALDTYRKGGKKAARTDAYAQRLGQL